MTTHLTHLGCACGQGDHTEIMRPRAWVRAQYSFDNFGLAFQSLIEARVYIIYNNSITDTVFNNYILDTDIGVC